MTFIWPFMLITLLFVPLIAVLYRRAWQRRQNLAQRFGAFGVAQNAGRRHYVPAALFLLGIALLAFASARPETEIGTPKLEGTILLTFDVSGSMAANDLQPSRMEAAKAAARAFVERQPDTVQIGVVSFSDGGFVVQRPTTEKAALLATIDRLAPQRATSLGGGMLGALRVITETALLGDPGEPLPARAYASEVIVLISDGENTTAPDPLDVAQLAAEYGVRVYTVGVGTTTGAILNIEGFSIQSMLDAAMLQQIAEATGGTYYNAQSPEDFAAIYADITPRLVIEPERMEITGLLAGLSLMIVLAGAMLSLFWFGRVP